MSIFTQVNKVLSNSPCVKAAVRIRKQFILVQRYGVINSRTRERFPYTATAEDHGVAAPATPSRPPRAVSPIFGRREGTCAGRCRTSEPSSHPRKRARILNDSHVGRGGALRGPHGRRGARSSEGLGPARGEDGTVDGLSPASCSGSLRPSLNACPQEWLGKPSGSSAAAPGLGGNSAFLARAPHAVRGLQPRGPVRPGRQRPGEDVCWGLDNYAWPRHGSALRRNPSRDHVAAADPLGHGIPRGSPCHPRGHRQRELSSDDPLPFTKPACGPGQPFRPCGGAGVKIM